MDEVARVPQVRTRRRSDRACVGLDGAKEQGQVGPLDALYCFRVMRYLRSWSAVSANNASMRA